MGMSTHACGFRPADEEWEKMKAVWLSCEKAGVEIPQNVIQFFDDEHPESKPGMEISLGDACREWSDKYREGYQIDVTKLPEGLKYIRVYNAW